MKFQFQFELSLAQYSPSLFIVFISMMDDIFLTLPQGKLMVKLDLLIDWTTLIFTASKSDLKQLSYNCDEKMIHRTILVELYNICQNQTIPDKIR